MPPSRADVDPIEDWLADFERDLRVANRAPGTSKVYLRSPRQLLEHVRASHAADQLSDVPRPGRDGWRPRWPTSARWTRPGVSGCWLLACPSTGSSSTPAFGVDANPAAGLRLPRANAIVLTLLECGLRRAELASLDVEHVNPRWVGCSPCTARATAHDWCRTGTGRRLR
jgi:integrase